MINDKMTNLSFWGQFIRLFPRRIFHRILWQFFLTLEKFWEFDTFRQNVFFSAHSEYVEFFVKKCNGETKAWYFYFDGKWLIGDVIGMTHTQQELHLIGQPMRFTCNIHELDIMKLQKRYLNSSARSIWRCFP